MLIIANAWKTPNAHVAALEDRGHLLYFDPTPPELHARTAWGVLALAVIVGVCRLLSGAWALEKSVTNVVLLAVGGATVTGGIATKAKSILGWFRREDLPLLGVFPPLIPVAAGLGLAFVAATIGVTAVGSVITNATQADTQHDLACLAFEPPCSAPSVR